MQVQTMHQYAWTQVGKAAGAVFTLIVTFIAGRFWRDLLKPFIQSFFWQGTQLAAYYDTEYIYDGKTYYDLIEVKQSAGRVSGTIASPQARTGKHSFRAELVNNVLRGTFEGIDKTSSARGSFVLTIKAGGRDLNGWCIEPLDGLVIAYEYNWRKKA